MGILIREELVDLLQHCESCGSWATNYDYNIDPVIMEVETRSYHPVSERDRRYFAKACVAAGIAK